MPVASSSKSVWPLAGYALLAAVAFARRGPRPRPASGVRLSGRGAAPLLREGTGTDEKASREQTAQSSGGDAVQDSSWWGLIKAAMTQWTAHKDARLGAAL